MNRHARIAESVRKNKRAPEENIMKIALPSRQNQVDEHFGHCEYFTVFTVMTTRNPVGGNGCLSGKLRLQIEHRPDACADGGNDDAGRHMGQGA